MEGREGLNDEDYVLHVVQSAKIDAVWAYQSAEIYADTDWVDLAGTIGRTQMDENV
jgi:hypothetical protein